MVIKEYFSNSELSCRCGCGRMPHPRAIELLYALRLILNEPITVTSASRCEQHHAKVGKSKSSFHVAGTAFDIVGPKEGDIIYHALHLGFKGIGISSQFTHIDLRDTLTFWRY